MPNCPDCHDLGFREVRVTSLGWLRVPESDIGPATAWEKPDGQIMLMPPGMEDDSAVKRVPCKCRVRQQSPVPQE